MRLLNYSLASLDAPEQPTVLAIGRERVTKPVTIRWHSHARGQAVVVSTGLLTIYTRQGNWMVPSGHSAWIPPGQEHALRLCGNFSGWYVYVAPEMCGRLPDRFGSASTPSLLREGIARISHWQDGADPGTREERLGLVVLDEIAALPLEHEHLPMPADRAMAQIARMIIDDPADNRSLDALADAVGLSRRTVTRRFADATGMSFSAWRQRLRLFQAAEMLMTGAPVTTVALNLGYDSPSAFTAMFRRHFGVTPSRFANHREHLPSHQDSSSK